MSQVTNGRFVTNGTRVNLENASEEESLDLSTLSIDSRAIHAGQSATQWKSRAVIPPICLVRNPV